MGEDQHDQHNRRPAPHDDLSEARQPPVPHDPARDRDAYASQERPHGADAERDAPVVEW